MKETDLFLPIKQWLEERGYEIFTEVEPKFLGNRADIVARSGNIITIVELKERR